MKPELTRRFIGCAAALIGLWWTGAVIFIPVRRLWLEDVGPTDVLFLLTVVPMMAIPGVLSLIFGIRLFRKMCEVSLKEPLIKDPSMKISAHWIKKWERTEGQKGLRLQSGG